MIIFDLILWFIIYSFLGWVFEEILGSVKNKKLVNRGFMSGPYCPIYGFGALVYIGLLQLTDNPFLLFFAGGFLACTLEYVTSYLMEKLFGARWWDYSDKPFNLNGRVYLNGFLTFAIAAALMPWVHGGISGFTSLWPDWLVILVCVVVSLSMLFDCLVTAVIFYKFNGDLAKFEAYLSDAHGLNLSDMRFTYRRILKAFPDLNKHYEKVMRGLRTSSMESAVKVQKQGKTARTKGQTGAKKSSQK